MTLQKTIIGFGAVLLGGVALLALLGTMLPMLTHADIASSTPVISNVVASTTESTATITWNTASTSNSRVAYGSSVNYNNYTATSSDSALSHLVLLTGLTPNTLYHFAVISSDASNTAT